MEYNTTIEKKGEKEDDAMFVYARACFNKYYSVHMMRKNKKHGHKYKGGDLEYG